MDLPFDRSSRRRLYLMRHAEAEYIRSDGSRAPDSKLVPLTSRGREEAKLMSDALEDIPFDKAICSGLRRTRETASIVLRDRKLSLQIMPELEEIQGGDPIARANISPVDYAYAMFRASEPDACYASGERFSEFSSRVITAFDNILDQDDWSCLLLVAHGGVNRSILSSIACGGLASFGSFEQDSACLNVIDIDRCRDTGAILRRILRGVNITCDDPFKTGRKLTSMEGFAKRLTGIGR